MKILFLFVIGIISWEQDNFYFIFTLPNSLIVSLCLLYYCYNGYTSQVQNINII